MDLGVNKILIYVIVGVLTIGALSGMFKNGKDIFFPPEKTYSLKAVKLILKHDRLRQEIKDLEIENEIIEKDNERITKDITADSSTIYDSSREFRDSLRAELFK